MGHADYRLTKTKLATTFQYLFDRRDCRLTTIHAKPLGAGVFFVKIALKLFSVDEPLIDRLLAFDRKVGLVANRLDTLLDPSLLCRILNMHELNAYGPAIGPTKTRDNFI